MTPLVGGKRYQALDAISALRDLREGNEPLDVAPPIQRVTVLDLSCRLRTELAHQDARDPAPSFNNVAESSPGVQDGVISRDEAAGQVVDVIDAFGLMAVDPPHPLELITEDLGVVCWMGVLPAAN